MLRISLLVASLRLGVCQGNYTNVIVSSDGTVVTLYNVTPMPDLPKGTIMTAFGGTKGSTLDGRIIVGGALLLSDFASPFFTKSMEMRDSATMFVQWLNTIRGGLRMGGKRVEMWLAWVDDRASNTQVTNATAHALRHPILPANFALGGYDSALTAYASMQAQADGKILMSAGPAAASGFSEGGFVFGLQPSDEKNTIDIFSSIVGKAETLNRDPLCSLSKSKCVKQLRYGSFGACGENSFTLAKMYFPRANFSAMPSEPRVSNVVDIRAALERLQAVNVTIFQVCGLTVEELKAVTEQMAIINFNVFALIAKTLVASSGYSQKVRAGWWQGGYVLDGVPWSKVDRSNIRGTFSNLTSEDFVSSFKTLYAYTPSELAAAQYAALCSLSVAIEDANSIDTMAVAAKLKTLQLREFYGDIQFVDNQINLTNLVIQADPTGWSYPRIVYPPARATDSLVFPKPTWAQMRCEYETRLQVDAMECSGHGTCDVGGICNCLEGWSGTSCHEAFVDSGAAAKLQLLRGSLCGVGGFIVFALVSAYIGIHIKRRVETSKRRYLTNFAVAIQTHNDDLLNTTRNQLRRIGWLSKRIAEYEKVTRRRLSEEAGVCVAYLLSGEFGDLARAYSGKEDPTFYDLRDVFFFGDRPIGADIICPRDGQLGCSLLDALNWRHRGQCTHFMSWTWAYKLSMMQSALEQWVRLDSLDPANVFIFMCFFVNNQYRILVNAEATGSDDLELVFERNLTRIGKVVAVLDTWDNPVYLTRVWTIFEQAIAIRLEIPVRMILPEKANAEFLKEIETGKLGLVRVKDALTKVDSFSAKASCPKDEAKVKHIIESTIGFKGLDDHVIEFMIKWVGFEMQAHMKNLVKGVPIVDATLQIAKI